MARKYELKKRAERQEATRKRIVEAAIELHRTKGPARTSVSDVARLAGVERHTLYRHFPELRDLFLACSGDYMESNPPPDPHDWETITDQAARLRVGLAALYHWYEHTEDMLTHILRDSQVDPLTREFFELRSTEPMNRIHGALRHGLGRGKRAQAALALALDFHAWHRLSQSGLDATEAAELMAETVVCADRRRHS
jgi:AcrR family transcriptional regulator